MERGTGHGPMSSDPELWSEVVDKDEHAGIALMSRQPIRWQCSCWPAVMLWDVAVVVFSL